MLNAGVTCAKYFNQVWIGLSQTQSSRVFGENTGGHKLIKLACPIGGLIIARMANRGSQIVHRVATGHNEHALVPQALQLNAQGGMLLQAGMHIQAHLNHRDVGIGEKRPQYTPSAMVKSPILSTQHQVYFARGLVKALGPSLGERGLAWGAVAQIKQNLVSVAKIMDGGGMGQGVEFGAFGAPVRRDAQNRSGLWPTTVGPPHVPHFFPDRAKSVVIDHIHGAAVSHEKEGLARGCVVADVGVEETHDFFGQRTKIRMSYFGAS